MLDVADFELEEHVAETNAFFQKSGLTLDDMNCYSDPFALLLKTAYSAANGKATDQEFLNVFRTVRRQIKSIDDRITAENELAALITSGD